MTMTEASRHAFDQAEMAEAVLLAQAALRVLPDTPGGIHDYLAELGCQGNVGNGAPTALEMYLRKSTGWDCDVARESVEWGTSSWSFTLKLSSVVSHFGWNYDAGEYPELYGHPKATHVQAITRAELAGLASMEG